jgi:hypothetical protein
MRTGGKAREIPILDDTFFTSTWARRHGPNKILTRGGVFPFLRTIFSYLAILHTVFERGNWEPLLPSLLSLHGDPCADNSRRVV